MQDEMPAVTRRGLLEMLAGGAGLAAIGWPEVARAQSREGVLVIGMDIGEAITFDPAQVTAYTPLTVVKFAYDTLVTMTPGDYINVKPALATEWQRTPDGKGWRFILRQGAKFNSGNLMTVEDVKWSFDRVINLNSQPAQYIPNIAAVTIVDADHIDIILKDPARSILQILCNSAFIVYERGVVEQHGGVATTDAPAKDKATAWLNQHSCGTGAYTLTSWERNSSVQLSRNPHFWRGMPAFERVILRHMPEPATQLLAIQRGDIDVAFNLIPDQVATVKQTMAGAARVERLESLDQVYLALTAGAELNKALAVRECREAIGFAIDYDGIKNGLLGGASQLAASILPIGTLGSTPGVAKAAGFHEDLARAKVLLAKGGFPDGFSFRLSYGNTLVAGVSYGVIGQKLQSDLARVGIKAQLDPLDPVAVRTQYNAGKLNAVLAFWNPAGMVDNWIWAAATVERLATRMHYSPPKDIVTLVDEANKEPNQEKQAELWIAYQKRMVEEAYLMTLFQPIYQIAVRERIKAFPLNAAGWQIDLYAAR